MTESGRENIYHLSHTQKRVWSNEEIYQGTPLNNIGGTVRIHTKIDLEILEQAIHKMIRENEGLRLRLKKKNGEIVQYVSDFEKISLPVMDVSKHENPEKAFLSWCNRVAQEPFVLLEHSLCQFLLFKISEEEYGYYIKLHHLIADGWSVQIITDQVYANYQYFSGLAPNAYEAVPGYLSYLKQEETYLDSSHFQKDREFWNQKFSDLSETTILETNSDTRGKRKIFQMDLNLTNKVEDFCSNYGCSINTFFTTVYLVYLWRTLMQKDIVLGIPVHNRLGKVNKQILGMFVNSVAFRYKIKEQGSFAEMIGDVTKELKQSLYHQKYPYDLLMQDLNKKYAGYSELYNVCINYYNTRHTNDWCGACVENTEVYNGHQIYKLQLIIRNWSERNNLELDFDYKISEYTDLQIEQMYERILLISQEVLDNPDINLKQITMISEAEKKYFLSEFNHENEFVHKKTIVQLFEEQVRRMPEKTACEFDEETMSYDMLNRKANQLARYLRSLGIKEEDKICLLTSYSFDTIVGILGILKAQGAYVPLMPDLHAERIHYILKDTGAKLLLTNLMDFKDISFEGKIISFQENLISNFPVDNLDLPYHLESLCYLIYTSGSTGKPKGTMIKHRGLVNYIAWAKKTYVGEGEEAFPLFTSLSFDLTVTSIFTPLISGNRIVIYPPDGENYVLERIIRENKVTIIKMTPSQLVLLKEIGIQESKIHVIIVGGESFKTEQARETALLFQKKATIYNEYGPTETVVGSMIYRYDLEKDKGISVPIGVPIDNTQIYLLDEFQNPVPVGAVGELYISGDGVAKGYLNRKEESEQVFLPNPFIKDAMMYKTGDLAIFQDKHTLVYLGRRDFQLKINGHRIEISEIENCLLEHEAVVDAAVIPKKNNAGNQKLFAFVVTCKNISKDEIRSYLLKRLAPYMVPSYYRIMESLPLTANGKIDTMLLRNYCEEKTASDEYVGFRNEKEKLLTDIIGEVLAKDRISVKDNFYLLGGDSIKAIQIASRVEARGYKLAMKDILHYPVVEEMAMFIHQKKELLEQQEDQTIYPIPILKWFLNQPNELQESYSQAILLDIRGVEENHFYEEALNEIVKLHPAFYFQIVPGKKEIRYAKELQNERIQLRTYDCGAYSIATLRECVWKEYQELKKSIHLDSGILLKGEMFQFADGRRNLLLVSHHIAIDVLSWSILLEDLKCYIREQKAIRKTRKEKVSYQQWTCILKQQAEKMPLTRIQDWKKEEERKNKISKRMWKEFVCQEQENITSCSVSAPRQKVEEIARKFIQYLKLTRKDIFVILSTMVYGEITKNKEAVFWVEDNGRFQGEPADILETTGWFTNTYPVRIEGDMSGERKKWILSLKEQIHLSEKQLLEYQLFRIREDALSEPECPYIQLNYIGDMDQVSQNEFFQLNEEVPELFNTGAGYLRNGIEVIGSWRKDKFTITVNGSSSIFTEERKKVLEQIFRKKVESLWKMAIQLEEVSLTPADFDLVTLTQEQIDALFS